MDKRWGIGDQNTAMFHRALKQKYQHNKIYTSVDAHGKWVDSPKDVPKAFLDLYEQLLGSKMTNRRSVVSEDMIEMLRKPYIAGEVKRALFDIDENMAPGPNGFGSKFFKASWDTFGDEVCLAVLNFFHCRKLLRKLIQLLLL